MNWEKILGLDAKSIYKSINALWWLFILYCFIIISTSYQKPNEMVIPINFKTALFEEGIWQNGSTNEFYKVTAPKSGHFELKVVTDGYPIALVINKFSQLLYLFLLGFIFWQIKGLAKTIKNKTPFEKHNIKRINRIGFTLIILGFAYPFIDRYLAGLAKTYIQMPDLELKPITQSDWTYYVMGLAFILIAQVFKKGIELREENALTI